MCPPPSSRRVQALAALRQFLGFESVPENYDVDGELDYQAVHGGLDDLKMLAMRSRPDLAPPSKVSSPPAARNCSRRPTASTTRRQLQLHPRRRRQPGSRFSSTCSSPSSIAIRAKSPAPASAITQSAGTSQPKLTQQLLTDVVRRLRKRSTPTIRSSALSSPATLIRPQESRDISEYAYQRGAASLLDYLDAERSYRANQLAYRQALAAYMLALEQTAPGRGHQELAMRNRLDEHRSYCRSRFSFAPRSPRRSRLAGCGADEPNRK